MSLEAVLTDTLEEMGVKDPHSVVELVGALCGKDRLTVEVLCRTAIARLPEVEAEVQRFDRACVAGWIREGTPMTWAETEPALITATDGMVRRWILDNEGPP